MILVEFTDIICGDKLPVDFLRNILMYPCGTVSKFHDQAVVPVIYLGYRTGIHGCLLVKSGGLLFQEQAQPDIQCGKQESAQDDPRISIVGDAVYIRGIPSG